MVFDITENVLRYLLYKYRLLHNVHFFFHFISLKNIECTTKFLLECLFRKVPNRLSH